MKDPDELEFQRLLEQAIDDTLSPEEVERLQKLARGNPDRLEQLVDHALIASLLTEEGGVESVADLVNLTSGEAVKPQQGLKKPSATWRILPWAIAATVTLALVIMQSPLMWTEDSPMPESESFGLLVDEAGAEFAKGFGPEKGRLDEREYRLESGKIHFRLSNGADVVMRAPAAFRLRDAFHLELLRGSLRAIIPPTAEGFTVGAPEVEYEDLGTEFGVTVDDRSGASRIHVFDGQVNAKDASSSQLLSSITSGQTMQFAGEDWERANPPGAGEYPVPGEIGMTRWETWRRQFVKDPSLVAFYSFVEDPDTPELLANEIAEANEVVSDGSIKGARWVSGRWPGKSALLFDRDDDEVAFTIPGELEELTLSFWVKVDRLDYEYNALINSRSWEPGDLHFQIKRTGYAWANVNGRKGERPDISGDPILRNRWQHVVGVISPEAIKTYVNGKLVWEQKRQVQTAIAPGTCSLGNWLDIPGKYQPTRRALKGRMDEVAIWNRALGQEEIQAHFESGRPSLLEDGNL